MSLHNVFATVKSFCSLPLLSSFSFIKTINQFRKCLLQHFTGVGTIPESNMNQTSDRPGMTAESQTGEMSAIAAHIPVRGAESQKSDDSATNCDSSAQLPIPENKVCPM